MDIKITPSPLYGQITAPSSKSSAHRGLICAALAQAESRLENMGYNDDIMVTLDAAQALGAQCVEQSDTHMIIKGIESPSWEATINCKESGSSLRFFVPIAAALGVDAHFLGQGKLPNRPMSELMDALKAHGISVNYPKGEIFSIEGQLQSGGYYLPGNISSQYITGLLFALPLLAGDSEIILTSPLESAGYVAMTIETLQQFGVKIEENSNSFFIKGHQHYRSCHFVAEGDYSGAAFWLAAGAAARSISVSGLRHDSTQADKEILLLLHSFGAEVSLEENATQITAESLHGITIDAGPIPDLVPILAVLGALAQGKTTIYNAARLRIKESDRLAAMTQGLQRMGVDIVEESDSLIIHGGKPLQGAVVDSFDDHRIAMAMSIAATFAQGEVTIQRAECVNKSYPDFYKDFQTLGGKIDVLNLG